MVMMVFPRKIDIQMEMKKKTHNLRWNWKRANSKLKKVKIKSSLDKCNGNFRLATFGSQRKSRSAAESMVYRMVPL